MIDTAFFHSTEFFVIAAVLAALIVGFCARPSRRGEARQFFVRGDLSPALLGWSVDQAPTIEVSCMDSGSVMIVRRGLPGLTMSGTVTLVVTIIGNDVKIVEKVVDGSGWGDKVEGAMFVLDMLGSDRYHLQYVEEATGKMAAFALNNRPGFHTERALND